MAKMQTQGKGQRGTSWVTVPGENLTVSIYLKPTFLEVSRQFMLTVASSLAVHDVVRHYVNNPAVCIKWPNDIYIENKKVCGILVENKITGGMLSASVIGIGLNVNQTVFADSLREKAVSLRLSQADGDMSFVEIIRRLQHRLRCYHDLLAQGKADELLARYNDRLFQKGKLKSYVLRGDHLQGEIVRVEEDGLLHISVGGRLLKFDLKDVVYQL